MPIISVDPLERALRIIGGRWRLMLVYFLLYGPRRFSDLEKDVPKISQRMLALDLRRLEQAGIVSREVLNEFPVKIEYRLTGTGLALRPIVTALYEWGEELSDRGSELFGEANSKS
jgi:DNA-binding HxlR family transcriptional regulator